MVSRKAGSAATGAARTLTATGRPSRSSKPRQTTAMPPAPSCSMSRYRSASGSPVESAAMPVSLPDRLARFQCGGRGRLRRYARRRTERLTAVRVSELVKLVAEQAEGVPADRVVGREAAGRALGHHEQVQVAGVQSDAGPYLVGELDRPAGLRLVPGHQLGPLGDVV